MPRPPRHAAATSKNVSTATPPAPPPSTPAATAPSSSHSPGFKRFLHCFIDEAADVEAGGRRHLSQPLPVSPTTATRALLLLLLLASGELMIYPWISLRTPRAVPVQRRTNQIPPPLVEPQGTSCRPPIAWDDAIVGGVQMYYILSCCLAEVKVKRAR